MDVADARVVQRQSARQKAGTEEDLKDWETIPKSLKEAKEEAAGSDFIKSILPQSVIDAYLR